MRSCRRSKFFLWFCSLFSILFSDIFFLSCIFSRHQPKRCSKTSTEGGHLYTSTLEWALAFSTQETSWDIDRGWTSHWIFLRYHPKRRRETSTGGRYLDTSTLEWALAVSLLFFLEKSSKWIFKNNNLKFNFLKIN